MWSIVESLSAADCIRLFTAFSWRHCLTGSRMTFEEHVRDVTDEAGALLLPRLPSDDIEDARKHHQLTEDCIASAYVDWAASGFKPDFAKRLDDAIIELALPAVVAPTSSATPALESPGPLVPVPALPSAPESPKPELTSPPEVLAPPQPSEISTAPAELPMRGIPSAADVPAPTPPAYAAPVVPTAPIASETPVVEPPPIRRPSRTVGSAATTGMILTLAIPHDIQIKLQNWLDGYSQMPMAAENSVLHQLTQTLDRDHVFVVSVRKGPGDRAYLDAIIEHAITGDVVATVAQPEGPPRLLRDYEFKHREIDYKIVMTVAERVEPAKP